MFLQIADGTRITLKILARMAMGDAYHPSERGTHCYHGGVIELGVHLIAQRAKEDVPQYFIKTCVLNKTWERARFLVEKR